MEGNGKNHGALSPCAACKLIRRTCVPDCIFAPYFPADEPQKFASVHKVFGASNVNKMLRELAEHQRNDAVSSMVYEANARVRDPVYGCVGAISSLQRQVSFMQNQLALAQAEVVRMRMHQFGSTSSSNPGTGSPVDLPPHQSKALFCVGCALLVMLLWLLLLFFSPYIDTPVLPDPSGFD